MVFSSNVFLFAFLPCVLVIYYLLRRWRRLDNVFLTVASLGFYAWGEPRFVLVMMLSITVNWLLGLWVDRVRGQKNLERLVITLMAVFNLGLLGVFKYLVFLMESINCAFGIGLPVPEIALPIGISFFTFQAMSYVIDVKRGNGMVQKNLLNVALYISFFPQLIAGPIVRYQTVADEIMNRRESFDDFIVGARRFLIGLSKKILLANNLGLIVDTAWALESSELSVDTSCRCISIFRVIRTWPSVWGGCSDFISLKTSISRFCASQWLASGTGGISRWEPGSGIICTFLLAEAV